MFLIRRRAWWFNKVPLSVLFFLLIVDGRPFTRTTAAAFLGLILAVCCAANYGYALNELFDVAEDRRGGRTNAAFAMGKLHIWAIIAVSALNVCVLAALLAGAAGLVLALCELLVPLAYSIPPVRLKERRWFGIFADASAAHVFPVALALLIVSRQSLGSFSLSFVITALLWATATGLRGILSHQLQSGEHDRAAGLMTVVHCIGHARLKSWVVFFILPVEIVCFGALIFQSGAGLFFKMAAFTFVTYELIKFWSEPFSVVVFDKVGERYIPFVDEGFYKVWGPLALAVDAAFSDALYLVLAPLCVYAFWPRVAWEQTQIALTARTVAARLSHQSPAASAK